PLASLTSSPSMRWFRFAVTALAAAAAPAAALAQTPAMPSSAPTILHADLIVDGHGHVIKGGSIVVSGDKISRVDNSGGGAATYDLKGMTLLPGLIDAHSHLSWYFNRQGRLHQRGDGDTPVESMLSMAGNAYATLMAGVTTIQSPGDPSDKDLREWIAAGEIPGPRVLTSLAPFSSTRPTPDSLRALVRQRKEQGADVIKIFASARIRCPTNSSPPCAAKRTHSACARWSTRTACRASRRPSSPAASRSSMACSPMMKRSS